MGVIFAGTADPVAVADAVLEAALDVYKRQAAAMLCLHWRPPFGAC